MVAKRDRQLYEPVQSRPISIHFVGEFPLATATYECLFLFDSNRYARDPGGVSNAVQDAITELGGEILVSRLWAEQKLAYPIKGHQKGTYWLMYFTLDSLRLTELNRACQLNESSFVGCSPESTAIGGSIGGTCEGKVTLPRPEINLDDDDAVAVGADLGDDVDDFGDD